MRNNYKRVTNPDTLPMVLTPLEIGDVLGLSRNRVYELMHSEDFPAFKIGKRLYRIRKDKFLAWLDKEDAA